MLSKQLQRPRASLLHNPNLSIPADCPSVYISCICRWNARTTWKIRFWKVKVWILLGVGRAISTSVECSLLLARESAWRKRVFWAANGRSWKFQALSDSDCITITSFMVLLMHLHHDATNEVPAVFSCTKDPYILCFIIAIPWPQQLIRCTCSLVNKEVV